MAATFLLVSAVSLTVSASQDAARLLKPGLWEITTQLDKTWTGGVKACLAPDRFAPSDATVQVSALTCSQRVTKDEKKTLEVTSSCQTTSVPTGHAAAKLVSQIHLDAKSPIALAGTITATGGNLFRGLKTSVMGRWVGDSCDKATPALANIASIGLVGTPLAMSEAVAGRAVAGLSNVPRAQPTYQLDEGHQSGCTNPTLVHQVNPKYTGEAMRAKVQGDVDIEAVVQTDGTVGAMRISRSLDPTNGLDFEAVWAARQWRFVPARCGNHAVNMIVTLRLQFRLH